MALTWKYDLETASPFTPSPNFGNTEAALQAEAFSSTAARTLGLCSLRPLHSAKAEQDVAIVLTIPNKAAMHRRRICSSLGHHSIYFQKRQPLRWNEDHDSLQATRRDGNHCWWISCALPFHPAWWRGFAHVGRKDKRPQCKALGITIKLIHRPLECLILYMNTQGAVASVLVMMLLFSDICGLLEQLSSLRSAHQTEAITQEWFDQHVGKLQLSVEGLALLSCFIPARRCDRVYGLSEKHIARIAAKAWGIGTSRQQELERMRKEENLDCATAVMKAVAECGAQRSSRAPPTITELDYNLDQVAALCDFSDVELRKRSSQLDRSSVSSQLTSMFQRMSSREVKWMVRLLLKDLTPAIVPEELIVELVHPSLPSVLSVLDSFPEALSHLQERESTCSGQTLPIVPHAGTRVSLPRMEKARSIKHGHFLMRGQEVSVERKYDGEYCQVHIWQDSHSRQSVIKLFSKSGRDSTVDRDPILPTIRQCLGGGRSADRVQKHCILVGELVLWNDLVRDIMPFYQIRRHVTRAGRRLGCQRDSSPDPDEHLMIVFHDILMWDDHICMYETYRQRRQHLQTLVEPVPGRAAIGRQIVLDFTGTRGTSALACEMAYALSKKWEGLVLKACRDPYIDVHGGVTQYVKVTKDYILGSGDSVDLLVVGGRCDPVIAARLTLMQGTWTTFFLACQQVDREVSGIEVRPSFRLVGTVSRPSISMSDIRFLNAHGRLSQRQYSHREP